MTYGEKKSACFKYNIKTSNDVEQRYHKYEKYATN